MTMPLSSNCLVPTPGFPRDPDPSPGLSGVGRSLRSCMEGEGLVTAPAAWNLHLDLLPQQTRRVLASA